MQTAAMINRNESDVDAESHEAEIFCHYLTGMAANQAVQAQYSRALASQDHRLSARDQKLLRLCVRTPWLVGFIDGGLAIDEPSSELRRRLYVMFAILESQPQYAACFLPRQRSGLYIIVILAVGLRAAMQGGLGFALVKAVRA